MSKKKQEGNDWFMSVAIVGTGALGILKLLHGWYAKGVILLFIATWLLIAQSYKDLTEEINNGRKHTTRKTKRTK